MAQKKHVRELEPWETYLSKETWTDVVKKNQFFKKKIALRGTLPLATWLPGPQPPGFLAPSHLASWLQPSFCLPGF